MFGPLSEWFIQNQRVDLVFNSVLLFAIIAFLFGESFWFTRKLRAKQVEKVYYRHLEVGWSLIPLLVLLSLTFVDFRALSLKKMLQGKQDLAPKAQDFRTIAVSPTSLEPASTTVASKLRVRW